MAWSSRTDRPAVVDREGGCAGRDRTTWKKRSQSAGFFSVMKSNSLASDHHTLRYAASRAITYFRYRSSRPRRACGRSPSLVVRVEEDQVGLDAEVAELADPPLEVRGKTSG